MVAVIPLCAVSGLAAPANATAAAGTTYYVDSGGGSDSNSGTAPGSAWASLEKVNATTFGPGDEVVFKAGATWKGQLTPKGSGAEGSPIVVDRYGDGAPPRIDGAGVDGGTVQLKNQEYFEIRNLEITNMGDCRCGNVRNGILVLNNGGGKLDHIHITGNYVHDVNSTFWHFVNWNGLRYDAHEFGGIAVNAHGGTPADTYNDVLIEGNRLESVGRTGIIPWNDHYPDASPDTERERAITNLVIRNNHLKDIDADGIFIHGTDKALMEHNTVNGASRLTPSNIPPEDAPAPDNLFRPSVAMWVQTSWDPVMQYNEAYNTHDSGGDNQGYDIDVDTKGALVQYNYSHNNAGGFMLIMLRTSGNVIRYNISENDGPVRDRLFHFIGIDQIGDTEIYNNVFYVPAGNSVDFSRNQLTANIKVRNNIFYWLGGGNYPPGGTWDANVFYGTHPASEPSDPHKLTSDPELVGPGTGGIGLDSVGGYRLHAGSPALNSGAVIADNGGKDYWGNPVSAAQPPSRGAFQGPGLPGGLTNAGFESEQASTHTPTGWATDGNDNASYTESSGAGGIGAHSGNFHLTHYSPHAYQVSTHQTARDLPNGTYTLTAWVRSSGGQAHAHMYATGAGTPKKVAELTQATPDWKRITIPDITVTKGKLEVGFYSKAHGGQWIYADDLQLTRN